MARLTPAQIGRRRRIESVIGLAAPALDLLLWSGEQLSKVAGRNELPPDPPRRLDERARAALTAPRTRG